MTEITPPGIPQAPENRRAERLSDEQMGNLLASIGNHEAKALTLLIMKPNLIYTSSILHSDFMNAQGESPGWETNHSAQFGYCQQSLSPIGLVSKEVVDKNVETYGYMTTNFGEKVGKPLAALLLDFSRRNPGFSLYDFFGSTVSSAQDDPDSKKRSPATRFKIFYELATAPSLPINQLELLKNIPEITQGDAGNHLRELKRKKIIEYDSIKFGENILYYSLSSLPPQEEPPKYMARPTQTVRIYGLLLEEPEKTWTIEEITGRYVEEFGYLGVFNINDLPENQKINLKRNISSILSHLKKHGYTSQSKFGGETRSEINLSEEQRNTIVDLVDILDAFQNQNPQILERGRKLSLFFLSNPQETARLMEKAKEHSHNANRKAPEEYNAVILGLISQNPGITSKGIAQRLNALDYKIGEGNVKLLIRNLSKTAQVETSTVKGTLRYSIKSPENPSVVE